MRNIKISIILLSILLPSLLRAQNVFYQNQNELSQQANADKNSLKNGFTFALSKANENNYFSKERMSGNNPFFEQYKKSFLIIPSIKPVGKTESPYHASLLAQEIVTTNDNVPFWMRSNQYGSIPLDGLSVSLIGHVSRDYDSARRKKLLDWGAGFEGRANVGKSSELLLIEGYVKARFSIFELKAGRSKDIMGLLVDSTLSSGAFSISGNALGIPKVQIGIPEYYSIPILGKMLAFKGNYVHGWLGTIPLDKYISPIKVKEAETYFHQKSFYGRFGKPGWKLKIYGGFNHQVFWGSEQKYQGPTYKLSTTETYKYIVLGKAFGAKNIGSSKIGNHLGSIDIGFEYDFKNIKLQVFRQHFYDVGALYYLANIKDGLNGVKIENKRNNTEGFNWKKIVLEVFYSKSQGGEPDSKRTPSGDEDYYNSFTYNQGWSYEGLGLGNPFITAKRYAQSNLPTKYYQYFSNNRVVALHTGFQGNINAINFLTKLSYSKNYGTWASSEFGYSGGNGIRYKGPPPYFPEAVNQFSGYLEANMSIGKGYNVGAATALDAGKLLNNSFGFMVSLKKNFF